MIDFTLGLFAGLTFWPIAVMLLWLALTTYATARDQLWIAILATALALIVLTLLDYADPFGWLVANPGRAVAGAILYLLLGVAWAVFKWNQRARSKAEDYKSRFPGKTSDARDLYEQTMSLKDQSNKARLEAWVGLWPFSLFGYVFGDLLFSIFGKVVDLFSGLFDGVTRHNWPPR